MEDFFQEILAFLISQEGKITGALTGLVMVLVSSFLSFRQKFKDKKSLVKGDPKIEIGGQKQNEKIQPIKIEEDRNNIEFIRGGLAHSRLAIWKRFKSLFNEDKSDQNDFFLKFEEMLIESDLGVLTSKRLVQSLRTDLVQLKSDKSSINTFQLALKDKIKNILEADSLSEILPEKVNGHPKIIMIVGVNGAGKTTTAGKLAFQLGAQGAKVLIAACDTFRAAATEQLDIWATRATAMIEKGGSGEKPSTVAYRAVRRAIEEGVDVVLVDTAGRLHTKVNLMNELSSITNILSRECPEAPHETLLVVDGSTGQNALQQAKEFNNATTLSGIVVTKLDGTPKGGIVVAIKEELGLPVRYIGIGEGVADLRPFDADDFSDALFGEAKLSDS